MIFFFLCQILLIYFIGEVKAFDIEPVAQVEGEEPKDDKPSAKIKAALKNFWDEVVVKYSKIGFKKFINWLDEAGAKKEELSDDLLIVMEGEGEPTPQRAEEAEKEKEKAKLKAAKKAKYKSMLHLKPPTSSTFFIYIFSLIPLLFPSPPFLLLN